MWHEIQNAVDLMEEDGSTIKKVVIEKTPKTPTVVVYRTDSCIRIDIFHKESN